ncbi:MAG: hypothetical protein JO296_02720 [Pseudonocardiales bacterium]|nr:hypothetical protein [Pseudonocardiales bacterium]MBV9649037.1 hypothetical protein [Pseudonocardiales bacterium]
MTPARPYVRAAALLIALTVVAVLGGLVGMNHPALAQGSAAAVPAEKITTWFADLRPGAGDTNVRFDGGGLRLDSLSTGPASLRSDRSEGMLITAVQPLAQFSSQVVAQVAAEQPLGSSVAVDVRGTRGDGSWTEWVPTAAPAPARLGAAVTAVQARVVLRAVKGSASPVVRSVRLTAKPGMQLLAARSPAAPSYRVFATREGLVGATTANGHVIRERDHFVALPSRRGLAPRDSGDYTVKICAANGRCEWAPVWDVGPWNTTDDYWSSADTRQSWADLPQGQPQAQAAYSDGYHDGTDQFGRKVRNPAGIDLADGTFFDGLGLRDNSWVTVSYLWVQAGSPAIVQLPILPVRSGPSGKYPTVGLAAQGAELMVQCAVRGEPVTGNQGSTDQWLRIGPKQYIPAAHVSAQPGPGAAKGATERAVKATGAAPAAAPKQPADQNVRKLSAEPCTTP